MRAGENNGVTLQHDRGVTRLWGPWPLRSETLTKVINVKINPKQRDWGLTAFVQDAHGDVLQSLRLDGPNCR